MKLQLNTYYTNLLREQLKFNPNISERDAFSALWPTLVAHLGIAGARSLLNHPDRQQIFQQVKSELLLDSLEIC